VSNEPVVFLDIMRVAGLAAPLAEPAWAAFSVAWSAADEDASIN